MLAVDHAATAQRESGSWVLPVWALWQKLRREDGRLQV
jgi:hypothetical protein